MSSSIKAHVNKVKAFLVVGAGHHARRIYIPELIKNETLTDVKIVLVDVFNSAPQINEYIVKNNYANRVDAYFLRPDEAESGKFEGTPIARKLLQDYDITGVIISTDPTHHVEYAQWALKNNLHILMDKPISTHDNAVSERSAARAIETDYLRLMKLYKKSRSLFCISTQRRYEPGYQFVYEKLAEVAERFNMPVTSIQAFHSDGLWILPDEIMHQKMHPYNTGYGKLSHSGFHILDIVWQLYTKGTPSSKRPDHIDSFAQALYPSGLMENVTTDDYKKFFGDYTTQHNTQFYKKAMKDFGEIDLMANLTLRKGSVPVGLFSVNLLHSSFSRRSWRVPSEDLYKGNGRVKHQLYIIEQGPLQCIQIHNYQATDEHDNEEAATHELGMKNHFDVHMFRNSKMFSESEPSVVKFTAADLEQMYDSKTTGLSNEHAKHLMIEEFVENCISIKNGSTTRDKVPTRNGITSYEVPVKLMAALYESLVEQKKHRNPVVRSSI